MDITQYVFKLEDKQLSNASAYLRQNLMVVDASESYYRFVGKNSSAPFDMLLHPDDRDEFVDKIKSLNENEDAWFMVRLANPGDDYRMTCIKMFLSNKYEDDVRLYAMEIHDIMDMVIHYGEVVMNIRKYRRFLTLSGLYFYEYILATGNIKIYKYSGNKSKMVVDMDLDDWYNESIKREGISQRAKDGLSELCYNLKKGLFSFDITISNEGKNEQSVNIKGIPFRFNSKFNASIGIMNVMDSNQAGMQYFETSAARDSATGLLNKRATMEYIVSRLQYAGDATKWMIIVDIDNFKQVNDNYGHMFGDMVIQRLADILSETFEEDGIIGRFGGDEFFVFVEKIENPDILRTKIKTVSKNMFMAFSENNDKKINVTLSIGITRYPNDGRDYEDLFAKADKALYIAKEKGKNRFIIYDDDKHKNHMMNSNEVKTVSYSISSAKKTSMMSDIIYELMCSRADALAVGNIQRWIKELFDLDSVSIYTDYGKKRFSVTGEEKANQDEYISKLMDTDYYKIAGLNNTIFAGNLDNIKLVNKDAYELMVKLEMGAYVHCMEFEEKKPKVIVMFHIYNRNIKWSEDSLEKLGMLGRAITSALL